MYLIDVYKSFDYSGLRLLAGGKARVSPPGGVGFGWLVHFYDYERLTFNDGSLAIFDLNHFIDPLTMQPWPDDGDRWYFARDAATGEKVTDLREYLSGVYSPETVPEYSI